MLLFLLSGSATVASPFPAIMCRLRGQKRHVTKQHKSSLYNPGINGFSAAIRQGKESDTHWEDS